MKEALKLYYIRTIMHPLTVKSLSILILTLSYHYSLINTVHAENLGWSPHNKDTDPEEDNFDIKVFFGCIGIGLILLSIYKSYFK